MPDETFIVSPKLMHIIGVLSLVGAFFSLLGLFLVLRCLPEVLFLALGLVFLFVLYVSIVVGCIISKVGFVCSMIRSAWLQHLLCFYFVVVCMFLFFHVRRIHGVSFVDDSIVHMEVAQEVFLSGLNPYAYDYSASSAMRRVVEASGERNRRCYAHYAYWPGSFVFPAPLAWISTRLLGWYDGRIVLLFAFLFIWWSCGRLVSSPLHAGMIRLLLLCHPCVQFGYLWGAQNDLFPLALLVAAAVLLDGEGSSYEGCPSLFLAGCLLGASLSIKQTMVVPGFMLLLYVLGRCSSVRAAMCFAAPALLVPGVLVGWYMMLDPRAFLDDTVWYIAGGLKDSIPVFRFSIPAMAVAAGLVSASGVGAVVWGLRLCFAPVALALTRRLWSRGELHDVFRYGGLCLFVAFVTGRFCLLKYLVLSLMLLYGYGELWRMSALRDES